MTMLTFRPMPERPKHKPLGRGCKTRVDFGRAFSLLRYELARIGATDVIVEGGFTMQQLRQDGMPYGSAVPSHPAIRVSFAKGGKLPLSFVAGGSFDWVVNVYLIAMTLERLRAIDRYGTTTGTEQYRGWSQLPPGASSIHAAEWATVEQAMRFLYTAAGIDPASMPAHTGGYAASVDRVFRLAARRAHPDVGGTAEAMAKVNRAKEYIDREAKP